MALERHPEDWRVYPRAALVTGGARRLGRAIAEALAADGWAVAIHYNGSGEAAAETVRALSETGSKAASIRADLTQEAEVRTIVAQAEAAVGPLGLLVNNAAIFEMDRAATATRESWDRHLECNLRAPLVLAQDFAAHLGEDDAGLIVNMLDQRVLNPTPFFTSYTVAKMGLWTLTQTLALDLAPRIRVNGIGPGFTLPSPKQSQTQFDEKSATMPLGRAANPAEIVRALRYLIAATSVTGQMIAADGGQHLGWRV